MSDDRKPHWYFRKEINVSHILATATIAVSAFAWAGAMDRRVTVLETRLDHQTMRDEAQDHNMREMIASRRVELQEIRSEVRETNRKLDRLIERWAK